MRSLFGSFWNRVLGERGERTAASFLRRKGMRIIVRNYRGPGGEIDLIARDGETLVFVEVKTRKAGTPAEAVDLEKQGRITRTALHFLKKHGLLNPGVPSRFDVVAIVWPDGARRPAVEHFPNAFEAVGRGQMFS
jgi:putative endonuclease